MLLYKPWRPEGFSNLKLSMLSYTSWLFPLHLNIYVRGNLSIRPSYILYSCSAGIDFRRQNLTSKVYPRAASVNQQVLQLMVIKLLQSTPENSTTTRSGYLPLALYADVDDISRAMDSRGDHGSIGHSLCLLGDCLLCLQSSMMSC